VQIETTNAHIQDRSLLPWIGTMHFNKKWRVKPKAKMKRINIPLKRQKDNKGQQRSTKYNTKHKKS
jgi:hypothetical protein